MFRIDGLNVSYGESHVIRDVSFEVAAGESVAIMGRNGMGKTTLLKALIGMLRSGSGSIRLGDTCLLYTSPSPRDRQKSRMPSSA